MSNANLLTSKMRYHVLTPIKYFIALIFLALHLQAMAQQISVGILTNSGAQRAFYTSFAQEFERQNPGTQIKLDFKPDADFKKALVGWFQNGNGPQVINWQGGERLFQYVRQGHVADISEFWQQNGLLNNFTEASVGAVTVNDRQFGLPVSYYQWGFYYRKSLFDKLNLSPPRNWQQFLDVSQRLKESDVVPVTIGAKFKGPLLAWFDYLNLRINGLEFHQRLLQGDESFEDPRVSAVLVHWKELLDKQYFVRQYHKWNWSQAMPFLYHKMAGMTLMGNFFAGTMPPTIKDDFRFFPFPTIDDSVEIYEEAPLDVFMIPKYAQNNDLAKQFLLAIAGRRFQEDFNKMLGSIPPNTQSSTSDDYFIQQGTVTLGQAKGVSQFFDRDTNNDMAQAAMDIFIQFMQSRNVGQTQNALEAAKRQHLR